VTTDELPLVERMRPFVTTIFAEMSALAVRTGAINLGQGFPDSDGPASLLEDAVAAIRSGVNQYPPGLGVPELRQAIASHQKRFYGLDVDPDSDVLVTAGATEGIAATILALTGPGDEVVTFEPYYDSYVASIALSGATRRTVVLRRPDFSFDPDELAGAFTSKTRLILLNSPHNPTGKVFSRAELESLAELARRHDVLVVTDEVYEHQTFDGVPHIPMATLPDMAERTVTISSAGKTFSVTGWKIGWLHSSAAVTAAVRAVKQFLTYVNGAPFQPAVARALGLGDDFYGSLAADLQRKRDLLSAGLREAGFEVFPSAGTYFVVADAAPLGFDDGLELCWRLPELAGVAAVPVSTFHDDPQAARSLLRFAFCKRHDVLVEAADRLATLRTRLR
jgi:N-succinyldiaminopimelate aminotransferase